eukprot:608704-Hanusia_phi.AAC.1
MSWDGGVIRVQLASKQSACRLLDDFQAVHGRPGEGLIRVVAEAHSNNLQERDSLNDARPTIWAEVDLERIVNEASSTSQESERVVEDLMRAIAETVEVVRQRDDEQVQLRIEGAVKELFETLESPGNVSFPTMKDWTQTPAKTTDRGAALLKEKVERILQEHSWTTAKRR